MKTPFEQFSEAYAGVITRTGAPAPNRETCLKAFQEVHRIALEQTVANVPGLDLKHLPIPATLNVPCAADALRLRAGFAEDAYVNNGALIWRSNDRPVPLSAFREAFIEPPQAQAEVVHRSTEAFLTEYRAQNTGRARSDEEMSEMRANFPRGTVMVDVVTGDKVTL